MVEGLWVLAGRRLSICEERCVCVICDGTVRRVYFVKGSPLGVSDLGGLRLGGRDVFFFECHGLQGKEFINVGTGLWWRTRRTFLRLGW